MDNRPFDYKDNDAEIEAQTGARDASGFWSNPIVRIALFLLCCLAVSFVGRSAVNMIYAAMHVYPYSQDPAPSPYWQIFLPLTGVIGALTALCVMKRREGWGLWKSTGFGSQGVGRAVLVGLLAGLAISVVSFGITMLLHHRNARVNNATLHLFPLLMIYSLVLSIFRMVANATIFQGFILQELEKRWGTLIGLVVSCLFFCFYTNWYLFDPVFPHDYANPGLLLSLVYSLFGGIVSSALLSCTYLYTRRLWAPIAVSLTGWFFLSGAALLFHYSSNFEVTHFVEIVAIAWLIVLTAQKGEWHPGPGLGEIARAARANVVKIVDLTDPGKEVDGEPTPQPSNE